MDIPASLQPRLSVFQRHIAPLNHPFAQFSQQLLLTSDYAYRQVDVLVSLLTDDTCALPLTFADYEQQLTAMPYQSFHQFSRCLRQFRHRHFLRLLMRELSGLATTEETMASWSDCADAIILRSMAAMQQELVARYGLAYEKSGKPAQLFVLAMGKLGGRELNYSSDIDLIIAFSAQGHTHGGEVIDNQQYYIKTVQLFIQLLQQPTADGFVFRVDLRLRPNGDSGALVSSLAALETYYQEQGRDWERYAMVKARLIGATADTNAWFLRLITPFVYRRYVDFSVIESLRSMKALIEREVRLNPRLNDIKRGQGGIREVEFIIQNFQLIRGGRIPALQQQSVLQTLDVLRHESLLPRSVALKTAYLFLRKLENCLQSFNDKQTHSLPVDSLQQWQLLHAMGYETWSILTARLQQFQRIISSHFQAILRHADNGEDNTRLLNNQLMSVWHGHVEQIMAINLLTSLGYQDAQRCYQLIYAFRHSPRCRRLSQAARLRLDRFMVLLLRQLALINDTERVLLQVMHLLENIVGRSAYLALLTENPQTLTELLYWFDHSPFITALLVNQPFLLELLLTHQANKPLFSHQRLVQQLDNQLKACDDIELQDDMLRQFKLTNWLLAARAEMYGQANATQIGRFLSNVADVIVNKLVGIACQQLAKKYPKIMAIKAKFAIIAYGKLGSREMNYNSDLDLVFIHNVSSDEEPLVNRLTQKIIHMLTTRSHLGQLYAVDTRLRPSGTAGLLVTTLPAFADYQRTKAWTWEHQALIRARILLGNAHYVVAFKQLKQAILLQQRDVALILSDVLGMRVKINHQVAAMQHVNCIKYAPGGLVDLEFLVQFLILTYPHPEVNFSRYTNTLSLLNQLVHAAVIDKAQFHQLRQAYKYYHHVLHQDLLRSHTSIDDDVDCQGLQAEVQRISQGFYEVARC